MRQLVATLRHRPAPLVGTFVALFVAALLVTWAFSIGLAGGRSNLPAQRLAGTAVVVAGDPNVSITSGSGYSKETDAVPLTSYRRVPAALAARLAGIPGVRTAVADRSVPLALVLPDRRVLDGTSAKPLTGYGWPSAALTPFTLTSGHAPVGQSQLVVGSGVARAGLSIGDRVRLAGEDLPAFTVVGVASAPAHDRAADWAVFLSGQEESVLYGHPGQADVIGLVAKPGVSPSRLTSLVSNAVAGEHLSVFSASSRGRIEDLLGESDLSNLPALGGGIGMILVIISMFVVASAVALSVAERARTTALLRAVGATTGQVKRAVLAELATLGALAGLTGCLPGRWLASFTLRSLASHQMLPASARPWVSPWELLISAGAGTLVAGLSGLVAARRASRVRPSTALREASIERRAPRLFRLLLGLGALAGGVVLAVVTLSTPSASKQLNDTELVVFTLMAAVAFLAPYLVTLAELALRWPLRLFGRSPGRLASAEVRSRPRRFASAAAAIALAVAFVGSVSILQSIQLHGSVTESRARLAASEVVAAPGPGLAPSALAALQREPGVKTAVGLVPTTVYVPSTAGTNASAEAVTPGALGSVLHLRVTAGSLAGFGPGDIALSQLVSGSGVMGVHLGETVTTYLADGTPYRAKVTAIFSRSLGFADVIVPFDAAGGGHLGTNDLGEVLVAGGTHGGLTPGGAAPALLDATSSLATRYAGLEVASNRVANAQAELVLSQDSYADNLILWIIGALAAVALLNTLVVTTMQQREDFGLLRRAGATLRQLYTVSAWEAAETSLVGCVLGAGVAGAAIVAASRALTGSWAPYVPTGTVAVILGLATGLTAIAVLAPTAWMLWREAR